MRCKICGMEIVPDSNHDIVFVENTCHSCLIKKNNTTLSKKKYYHVSCYVTYSDFTSKYSEFFHVAIDSHPYIWEHNYKKNRFGYKDLDIAILWFAEIPKDDYDMLRFKEIK